MIPVTGMVDSFQKQYVSLKVPYPADNVSSEVDAQIKETKNEIDNSEKSSQAWIGEYQKSIDHLKQWQMTITVSLSLNRLWIHLIVQHSKMKKSMMCAGNCKTSLNSI